MPDYRVTWAIELEADHPIAAAGYARVMQIQPDTTAKVFQVFDQTSGKGFEIDLVGGRITPIITPEQAMNIAVLMQDTLAVYQDQIVEENVRMQGNKPSRYNQQEISRSFFETLNAVADFLEVDVSPDVTGPTA